MSTDSLLFSAFVDDRLQSLTVGYLPCIGGTMSDVSDSYISPATLDQIRSVVVEWSRGVASGPGAEAGQKRPAGRIAVPTPSRMRARERTIAEEWAEREQLLPRCG
ncbi:hypothetical protein ACFRLW_31120 [Streptomyces sp. NPDC056728]